MWHIIIPLTLYLMLAWRWERSLVSRRALAVVALVVIGGEVEEGVEKLIYGFKTMWSDVFGDVRDGLFWPTLLYLTSRWFVPPVAPRTVVQP